MKDDTISRKAATESIRECAEAAHDNHEWDMEQGYLNAIECIEEEPSAQPESAKRKMSNNEWIDFLVSQFDVSRTSAKEMLHGMMRWKKKIISKSSLTEGDRDKSEVLYYLSSC